MSKTAIDNKYDFKILNAVLDVNTVQRERIADKIINHFDSLEGKTTGIWGLAFKPNTDDIREAPALYTIDKLLEKGAKIKAFDPEAMANIKEVYGDNVELVSDQYEAVLDVDALAIMTEWSVFRTPSFKTMKKLMKSPFIFDGRNLYDLDTMKEEGFLYESIGRAKVN